jgi:pimeloyl-ACP methyl ester carboxylesterase
MTFNPYPNMQTNEYEYNFMYEMGNLSSDKLIINIEGSGWDSVLGRKGLFGWDYIRMGGFILQELKSDHVVIIPEKWKRDPNTKAGINSGIYYEDLEARLAYTADNITDLYVSSINNYLSERNYSSIILIGSSEGALLLPKIYQGITQKDKIIGLVSYAGGGLAFYESIKISSSAKFTPVSVKRGYEYVIENYDKDIDEWSYSIGIDKYGNVLLWLTNMLKYNPFEYWKEVHIPVLFMHGEKDYNVAVESTKYIQENLPEKPFEYIYYKNIGHSPNPWALDNYFQWERIKNDIGNWVRKIES